MTSNQRKQIVTQSCTTPVNEVIYSKQLEVFKNWRHQRDVLPLRYGSTLLGLAGSVTGFYINVCFRRKLKLLSFGLLQSHLTLLLGPPIMIHLTHKAVVLKNIVLYKYHCPICTQTKAVVTQVGFGLLYPLILSPVVCLAIAGNNGYKVPQITEVRELWKFFSSVCKPILPKLMMLATFHVLLATHVTYAQYEAIDKVQLIQMDDYYKTESLQ